MTLPFFKVSKKDEGIVSSEVIPSSFIVDFDKLITHVVGVVFQHVIGRQKQVTKVFHRNKRKFHLLPHDTHTSQMFFTYNKLLMI